ncbi:MAG TPA: hypothetical protein QGG70_04215 [Candidatus Pacearchaeota archaeon]|jgi:hypothetical protein|nr:hypothetical protein [Candidatus Pacearchaeota archaeon]|tara:strand:- start:1418 stop:1717 length:300 start_codon:yes stop_codon:yes gene_type:complete
MESEPAKLYVPIPNGKNLIPKMYKLFGRRIEDRFFTTKSMHKTQDGFGYAFDRVREHYPYTYSEVFEAIELPIKYNSHNRYFVDQDALALMDMRNFVPD